MKLKKVLAGILSAVMVASMIPAGMAFSGVSAEDTTLPTAVGEYDFSSDEGWKNTGVEGYEVTVEDGVATTHNGYSTERSAYSIASPLTTNGTGGITVVLVVQVPSISYRNPYESLFNFSDLSGAFASVSSDGYAVHLNPWDGCYYDECDATILDMTAYTQLVVTVTGDDWALYANGNSAHKTYNPTTVSAWATTPTLTTEEYIRQKLTSFTLGGAPQTWGQTGANFKSVSIYDSALTATQVAALYEDYAATAETDYTKLNAKIAEAKSISEASYTEASYSDLTSAITTAEAVVSDTGATQTTVDAQVTALDEAITALVVADNGIESGLISAYEFNGSLDNSVSGAGAATLTGALSTSDATATAVTYNDDNTAVKFNPTLAYGLKLGVDTSTIGNGTFTVSYRVSYAELSQYSSGFFIANLDVEDAYYSIGQCWTTSLDSMPIIWAYNSTYDVNIWSSNSGMALDKYVTITAVFDRGNGYIYTDGVLTGYGSAKSLGDLTNTAFYLGVNKWDAVAKMDVDNAYVYNRALSASDVAELAAKDIADQLALETVGMQVGTYTTGSTTYDSATRFIARLNKTALDSYNDDTSSAYISQLGWAYEAGTLSALTEKNPYDTLNLTTVTSATPLATDDTYAFTAVVADGSAYSLVPYVEITVNGSKYYYTASGAAGSSSSTALTSVAVITDFTPTTNS